MPERELKTADNTGKPYPLNYKVSVTNNVTCSTCDNCFLGISEYKQRLENSLKTEKAEHQQTKVNWENKLQEEKNKCDSDSNQSKKNFNSLQQHYNLLQVSIIK